MGGHQVGDALFDQKGQDALRQGRAVLGVGAGAQLIQQHQRFGGGLLEDADDIGDVPGKGGQRLFDGLLVADIGVNIQKDAEAGAGLNRDVQPGLRHERQQPDCFEGDGLAAGVGPGDDQ